MKVLIPAYSVGTLLVHSMSKRIVSLFIEQATLGELNINTNKPKTPRYSVYSKRLESYEKYSKSNPVAARDMCAAGFFFEGEGDKVKCFWCDGALEMWSKGDDPWFEHAK